MKKKTTRFNEDGLTKKQAAFVIEYLNDYNGKRAVIRAGYSEKGADVQAHRLLKNVKVSRALSRIKQERVDRTKIDSDYMLQRLAQIDKMKIGDILKDGEVIPIEEWPDIWQEMLAAQVDSVMLEELKTLKDGTTKTQHRLKMILNRMKVPDKLKNLELMGKHIDVRAFADVSKIEHGLTDEAATSLRDILNKIDGQSTGLRRPTPALPDPEDD